MAEGDQVYIRMSADLRKRIQALQERLHRQTGIEPSRSAVVKLLIERGLAALESETAPSRKR